MGCSKEKEEIEARVVGIGVDVKPDWCTGRSVLGGYCLVVCWW
jgi:histone acetyltransferase (RNA polymerase elongator complex component)